ncbi:hypothetical protein AD05_1897 [Escherichia coli 5-366-08_S4_C2]|nr:hypothetical protein AD05_1897 [Escherichia coli 5-366-08_S4_C2]
MPDATLLRLLRPTIVVRYGADKALAPHPPTVNRIIRSH